MANETNVSEGDSKSLIKVNATVDKAKITIGDKITYKIIVDSPEEIEVMFPEIGDKIGELTAVAFGDEELKKEDGRIMLERWYTLETYTTGSYIIPAINVKHKRKDDE